MYLNFGLRSFGVILCFSKHHIRDLRPRKHIQTSNFQNRLYLCYAAIVKQLLLSSYCRAAPEISFSICHPIPALISFIIAYMFLLTAILLYYYYLVRILTCKHVHNSSHSTRIDRIVNFFD